MIHRRVPPLTSTLALLADVNTSLLIVKLRAAGIRVVASEQLAEAVGAAQLLGLSDEDECRHAQATIRDIDVVPAELETLLDEEERRRMLLRSERLWAAVESDTDTRQ